MAAKIELFKGDITTLSVDVVVNAANADLAGGGGVDGAIHQAAGPELAVACGDLGGCETGDAKLTKGFNLAAAWIIHAVGPIWKNGRQREPLLLRSSYRQAYALAASVNAKSIALPAISCGAYGYPKAAAAGTAVSEALLAARQYSNLEQIILVSFDDEMHKIYQQTLDRLINSGLKSLGE